MSCTKRHNNSKGVLAVEKPLRSKIGGSEMPQIILVKQKQTIDSRRVDIFSLNFHQNSSLALRGGFPYSLVTPQKSGT